MPFIATQLPVYKGEAQLLIVSQALNKDTTLSDPDLPSIVTSTEVLSRVIHRLKLDTDPIKLAKKIKTKLPPKSSILDVTYKDTDRQRAADVTNAIADEAVSYFHEIAIRGYSSINDALTKQIAQTKATMAEADRRLDEASANSGFSSSDKALDDLTSQINDLQVQAGQVNTSLAADQATATALKKQLSDISPIVRGEILQKDIVYQQVQTVVGRDVADLVSQRSSFKDSFPGLAALSARVNRERSQAATTADSAVQDGAGESPSYTQTILDTERAEGAVAADRERLSSTNSQIAHLQTHLREVAGVGANVGTLRASRDADLEHYIGLTQRLTTAEGDAAQAASLGTLVVVSRAIPGQSSLLFYLAALAFALLLLAIGVAFIVDRLDHSFWSSSEIASVYDRPVIGRVGGRAA
jgi:capsular polysaccharide biosynthesis protein